MGFGRRPPPDALKERIRKVSERADAAPKAPGVKPNRPARQPVFKNGTVFYGDGYRLPVVIKDLSENGARIEYFQKVYLPDIVVLSEPMLKLRRRARVVWRREGAAGLAFITNDG